MRQCQEDRPLPTSSENFDDGYFHVSCATKSVGTQVDVFGAFIL
jgi:hypothetical protein